MFSGLIWSEGVPAASRILLVVFLVLPVATLAEAASWRFSPSLELAETYSDNIALRSAGGEQSDYVTEVAPGFGLSTDGRRLDLDLNYRWRGLYFARDNKKNTAHHQLSASMNSVLVNNLLFVDGNASYRQTVVAPGAAVGQGYIAGGANLQDVLTTSVSPYLRRRLGSWAEAVLRYTQSSVLYPDDSDRDSFSDGVDFRLVDQKASDRWSWSLSYRAQSIDYRTAGRAGVTTRQADLQLGYRLSHRLGLNGQVGREENEYPRTEDMPAPEGNFWDLGLDWQPSPRTQLSVGGGRRYYGSNWRLDLSHRGRRTTLSAAYSEGVTTRRQYQLADDAGRSIVDVNTQLPLLEILPLDEVYIRRRVQLNFSYDTRRSTSSFTLYQERRGYQESQIDETVRGTGIAWRWASGRRVDFNIGTDLVLSEYSNRSGDRRLASYAALTRKLGRYMDATLEARNTRRDSDIDYTENQLSARLVIRW